MKGFNKKGNLKLIGFLLTDGNFIMSMMGAV